MQIVKFGKTDMEITPIGFGSWAIGGSGWEPAPPGRNGSIVGGRRPDQVDGIVGATEFRLSDDKMGRIEGFIRENP